MPGGQHPQSAMDRSLPQTLQVEVHCIWRVRPHDSKITCLSVCSVSGHKVVSGCEGSRADDQCLENTKPAIKTMSLEDGTLTADIMGLEGRDISSIHISVGSSMIRLWAVAGDCSLWRSVDQCNIVYPGNHAMELVSRPDAKPLHVKVVPDPSSGSIHNGNQKMKPSVRDDDSSKERESVALAPDGISKEVSSAQGTPAVRGVEVQCTKTSQGSAMEDLKPGNFVKSKGYRGARPGFVFRNGPWGLGYYARQLVRDGIVYTVAPHEEMPKFKEEGQDSQEAREVCELPSKGGASTADVLFAKVPALVQGREVGGHGVAAEYERETSENPKSSHSEGMPAEQVERQDLIAKILAVGPALRASLLSSNQAILYTGSWGSKDTMARAWSTSDGSLLRVFEGHVSEVLALALGPDQTSLYTGSYDSNIREWDAGNGKCLQELRGHRSSVRGLVVSPEGHRLYSCSADNTIRVWDLKHGCCLRSFYGRHEDCTWPICMCITPDGQLLATGSHGLLGLSTVKIFHTTGASHRDAGKCLATLAHYPADTKGSRSISALAFSSCGKFLVSGGSDGSIAAWTIKTSWRNEKQSTFIKGFL